jgi:hypothetical protein
MKKIIAILASSTLACGLMACTGDDTTTPTDSGVQDTGTQDTGKTDAGDASNLPAPPKLGTQIDRMGRPAVNTALNKVLTAPDAGQGAAKDEYNANKDPSTWAKYSPEFQANLAVFDSLDTVCGNQIGSAGPDAGAGRYAVLGTALTSDLVWVNSTQTTCNTYLAVEVAFLTKQTINDCGGRTLKYDVIDSTYSALATGGSAPVTDGVGPVAAKVNGTTFPYLAPAQ